ncbi:integrase core domain protein [Oesophagostomum dentatum]|uniref:RNA-directed DNA polymerase n=1 Tax=Oesophagostomum dentatum TaxID=61180 RepID=A0A0B1TBN1_OESDE|nr:integrase core domain protein [Oesophagostomum dentatum]
MPLPDGESLPVVFSGLTLGQLAPKNIGTFSGLANQDFESWLRKFEDVVRMVNPPLPEQLKTNTLVGFLEGEARDLVEEMQDADKNSYDRLKPALRFHVKAANPANFDEAVVKAITYESLLADVANSLSILPGVQPAVPAVNVISSAQNPTRYEGRNDQQRDNFRNRQVRNYSNNFNRRVWERAPNSNVVCYRCGKSGHIQTFCRFSLPPANLRPPRQQFPVRNNFRSGRINQNSQQQFGYGRSVAQQPTVPQQRNDGRNPSRVLALEQTSATEDPNPEELSIIQQKDAHIAALIDRNNALADIAFATRNPKPQNDGEESSSYQSTQINCTKILPNWSATAQPLKIKVFRPNTIRYKSVANVCRIITQTIIYSVNFFGARSQKILSQEQTVSTGVCRHMATVYAYHGSSTIESSIGPLEGCQYKDGACTTKSGSAIIWEPETQESCRYVLVSPMKGVLIDKFAHNDSVIKFYPVTGVYEIIPSSKVTVIQHSTNRPQAIVKPALTLFHNLVITNISEFVPGQQFTELWSAIEALIDTGSSITLAAQDLCAALGIFQLDHPQTSSAMGMAGILVPMAGSKEVIMQIGNIELHPTIHFTKGPCVPNMNSDYEVIIGHDILAQLPPMTIDYKAQKVCFGAMVLHLGTLSNSNNSGEPPPYPVRVKDTTVLQPNAECFVSCTVPIAPPKDLVLVSQCSKIANKDLIVAPALISSNSPVVLVSNPTSQPVTLYAGMRLADASEVVQEGETLAESGDTFSPPAISCVSELTSNDPTYKINLTNSDLTESERKQLVQLLDSFADVFSRHQYDIGSCTAGKVHIYTTNDPPSRIRPYRVPMKYREELQKHVNMLLKCGVMKESHTPWVHNLVVVRKKDNSLRVCLDMPSEMANKTIIRPNGCLYYHFERNGTKDLLLLVPDSLRQLLFDAYHSSALSGGHMGWKKTLAKILRKYYWPTIYGDIHRWCESCLTCQMRRKPKPEFRERLIPVHSEAVFAKVGLDLCGPLRPTERGNKYILNIVCWFTRYVISMPLPDARANTIAHALFTECVLKYGTMSELISDQASSFTSHFYQEFCNLLHIQQKFATPYHSMGNGATERTFSTFQMMLSKFINTKQEDWDLFIPCVTFCYNTTINEATDLMSQSDSAALSILNQGVASTEEPSEKQPDQPVETDLEVSSGVVEVKMDEETDEHAAEVAPTATSDSPTPQVPANTPETTTDQVQPVTFPKGPARQTSLNVCGSSSEGEEPQSDRSSRSGSKAHSGKGALEKPTTSRGSVRRKITRSFYEQTRSYSRSPSDSESDMEAEVPVKKAKPSDEVETALASLVEQATLIQSVPPQKVPPSKAILYKPQDEEWKQKEKKSSHREMESFKTHPYRRDLRSKRAPVISPYYNTNLDAAEFEEMPTSGYAGIIEGIFPEPNEGVPKSLRSKITILDAVGPHAIEDFRARHSYDYMFDKNGRKTRLRTMALADPATDEEKNTYMHGLEFDQGIAPVLYRVKTLFGTGAKLEAVHFEVFLPDRYDLAIITIDQYAINVKTEKRGLDITKIIVGDLVWVYSLAVTTKFATTEHRKPTTIAAAYRLREATVWRVERFALIYRELRPTLGFVTRIVSQQDGTFELYMQGHRGLVTVNRNRLEDPNSFELIKPNSFIVAPFRPRQLNYVVFACSVRDQMSMLATLIDIQMPYIPGPSPAPFNIRVNSVEHQQLVNSKLTRFDLFSTSPTEVLAFLEPLYSTSCGVIAASVRAATDSAAHATAWRSPNINSFPILVTFTIPIQRKTGWAVGSTIRGSYESDFMDGQIVNVKREKYESYLEVTAKLETDSGVRFRSCILNARYDNILVRTFLYTIEERANPVLTMLEKCVISDILHPNSLGWMSARALLAGDIQLEGIDNPDQESITVSVDGTDVTLNQHQVNAVNQFNKEYPILIVDSAYGAGKSLCTAVMAMEAVRKDETILVAAVQNTALDVIGLKIAQLQNKDIRPIRYVNDTIGADPDITSPFALQTLMETFHETHGHLLTKYWYAKFRKFSESRREMREFYFTGTQRHVVTREHRRLLLLEQDASEDVKVLVARFLKFYNPNVYLCTISASLNLTSKKGLWRRLGNKWKRVLVDEASMVPESAIIAMLARFQNAKFTLVGDSKQLPPYVGVNHVPLAVEISSTSILDVAQKHGRVPVCMVSTVYRPHEEMMKLNSELFYDGQLICGTPREMRMGLLSRLRMPNSSLPVALVDVCGHSIQSVTGSHSNEVEARAVLVLTTNVTVGTVDSAQGSERSVVILCTTRTHVERTSKPTFFSDPRRLNVALSRAKDGMFILGLKSYLQKVETWSAIVEWCEQHGAATTLDYFDALMRPRFHY